MNFIISKEGSVSLITPQLQEEIDMEVLRMVRSGSWEKYDIL